MMDGWFLADEWMGGWLVVCLVGWVGGWIKWMDEWTGGWMNMGNWKYRRMDRDGQMDGWIVSQIYSRAERYEET